MLKQKEIMESVKPIYDSTNIDYYYKIPNKEIFDSLKKNSRIYDKNDIVNSVINFYGENEISIIKLLACSGYTGSERYLRKIMSNSSDNDEVFDVALGLAVLGFEEVKVKKLLDEIISGKYKGFKVIIIGDGHQYGIGYKLEKIDKNL